MNAEHPLESRSLEVATSAYPLPVIYRACYAFTDHAYLFLEPGSLPDTIRIHVTSKTPTQPVDRVLGDLQNALLDYALRWTVGRETADIRTLLVTHALAAAQGSAGEKKPS